MKVPRKRTKKAKEVMKIPEVNIGLLGHVDHGKTTLTQALSGKWTDTYSEELKRGITIKLGYANTSIYFDKEKGEPDGYNTEGIGEYLRTVSFVDAPGHEALMAVMLSGSAIMDGAILVIAANEGIRAQTKEHLMAAKIAGIENLVVVQNKIDVVSKERVLESYKEIQEFLDSLDVKAPVIPISALHKANIDVVLEALQKFIPTPKRDEKANPKFYVVRSFDINKPGTNIDKLKGGVLGGALVRGKLKVGDEIEIRPGIERNGKYEPIISEIVSIATENYILQEAKPGGSIAIETKLDPYLTKSDAMLGSVVGLPGKMPEMYTQVDIEPVLFDNVVGIEEKEIKVEPLRRNEPLIVNAGSSVTVALVKDASKEHATLITKKPLVLEKGDRIVISRKVLGKWRLIGYGIPKI